MVKKKRRGRKGEKEGNRQLNPSQEKLKTIHGEIGSTPSSHHINHCFSYYGE